jgi:hypothetical protein
MAHSTAVTDLRNGVHSTNSLIRAPRARVDVEVSDKAYATCVVLPYRRSGGLGYSLLPFFDRVVCAHDPLRRTQAT